MSESMDEVRLVKVLLDIPLFDDLDYTQISSIIGVCTRREAQPGEVLCEPRTVDHRLTVLLTGRVRLESAGGGKLADLMPVRLIGEMGVFTGLSRSSRVVVEEPAQVLELDADDLGGLVEEDPKLGNHMFASLVKLLYTRLHDINDDVEDLQARVARLSGRLEEVSPGDPLLSDPDPHEDDDDDLDLEIG